MKVRDLKNIFALDMDEITLTKMLTSVSHWVKILRKAKDGLEVKSKKDTETLKKLSLLNIVFLEKRGNTVLAKLTEEGKELYLDFFKHGYYEGWV